MKSRLLGFSFAFIFGLAVEILQKNEIDFSGSTSDPLDILMYGLGVILGLFIDLLIIDFFEKSNPGN